MRAALDSMEDPILHLAVHLTLVGALREGEIVGLPRKILILTQQMALEPSVSTSPCSECEKKP